MFLVASMMFYGSNEKKTQSMRYRKYVIVCLEKIARGKSKLY